VRVTGLDVAALSDREVSALRGPRRSGSCFQQFFLVEHQTVLHNVADALLYGGFGLDGRRARAAAVLDRVGLGRNLTARPRQRSGGERQRVAIPRVGDRFQRMRTFQSGHAASSKAASAADMSLPPGGGSSRFGRGSNQSLSTSM
jgi:ABC-type thiamine transport system ATPase subunit